MCAARDVGAKMPGIFQSSFRWRLMCAARDVGAKMAQTANLIVIPALLPIAATCRNTYISNRELAS
jgi:ABC-type spermidine/putrescine transport system permease subunit I